MISDIITYINSYLDYAKKYGLVEQYRDKGSIYPAEYCNSGEYNHIDFDKYKSVLYHRINGNVSRSEALIFGCEEAITETYPMLAVLYLPKDCDTDNSYSNLNQVNELANDIKNIDLNTLRKQFNLIDLDITINDTNIDSFSVWGSEFDNVNPRRPSAAFKLPSTHMLVSLSYSLQLTGTASCLASNINTTTIFKFGGIKDTLPPYDYKLIDTSLT